MEISQKIWIEKSVARKIQNNPKEKDKQRILAEISNRNKGKSKPKKCNERTRENFRHAKQEKNRGKCAW